MRKPVWPALLALMFILGNVGQAFLLLRVDTRADDLNERANRIVDQNIHLTRRLEEMQLENQARSQAVVKKALEQISSDNARQLNNLQSNLIREMRRLSGVVDRSTGELGKLRLEFKEIDSNPPRSEATATLDDSTGITHQATVSVEEDPPERECVIKLRTCLFGVPIL